MSDYIWHHVLYKTGDGPRYRTVVVLAWQERTAIVLSLVDGAREVGATPYSVNLSELRFGYPPESEVVAA